MIGTGDERVVENGVGRVEHVAHRVGCGSAEIVVPPHAAHEQAVIVLLLRRVGEAECDAGDRVDAPNVETSHSFLAPQVGVDLVVERLTLQLGNGHSLGHHRGGLHGVVALGLGREHKAVAGFGHVGTHVVGRVGIVGEVVGGVAVHCELHGGILDGELVEIVLALLLVVVGECLKVVGLVAGQAVRHVGLQRFAHHGHRREAQLGLHIAFEVDGLLTTCGATGQEGEKQCEYESFSRFHDAIFIDDNHLKHKITY